MNLEVSHESDPERVCTNHRIVVGVPAGSIQYLRFCRLGAHPQVRFDLSEESCSRSPTIQLCLRPMARCRTAARVRIFQLPWLTEPTGMCGGQLRATQHNGDLSEAHHSATALAPANASHRRQSRHLIQTKARVRIV